MGSLGGTATGNARELWQPNKEPIRLWLDCDTGHDDAFAILLAAHCPAVELLGISTVHGNAHLEHTTYNTRAVLKAINREDVPVVAGASKPFCREPTFASSVHGETGLHGTPGLPTPTPIPMKRNTSAVEEMYRALKAQEPNTAYLVATGSLTNIALLFALYPDLADHIRGLSIMGGGIGDNFANLVAGSANPEHIEEPGNTTAWAEFNIYCDPEAARAVFSNPKLAEKTMLIPLDLTHQMLATPDVMHYLRYGTASSNGASGDQGQVSPTRQLFSEILSSFAKSYAELCGLAGPPLHDPLAVAICFVPNVFDDRGGERFAVDVVTDGAHPHSLDECADEKTSQCGRTVAKLLPKGSAGVCIPRTLDVALMWQIIQLCLDKAENGGSEAL
ncbi:hypothetical protein HIM_09000 [Hirsutella minnesotensis 3608]|uniref:Inosine/uridine-preferring nucleoside hydrolase domain-containing protein n=1 Tax=Hirsutella minnesotensis 3608 TaxID=1043627 RepID=A0A0F7ZGW6_9HYPO|nr:hypothetical protein HIM_09000 [Hirsutella minnesotensis 3608]